MLITYLIPVYNEKKTIKKAIIQAIRIPIKKKEIIIIDNNSTDGSTEIIKKFAKKKNINVILRHKDLGFGATIHEGIKKAKGKYIFIHYSDLEYDINASSKMLKIAEKKKLDVIFASRLINKLKTQNFITIIYKRPFYLASFVLTKMINFLFNKNFTDIIGTKIIKKKAIINILPKKSNIGLDVEINAMLSHKKFKSQEVYIKYTPRENFLEKKVKWWHIFNFTIAIFKVRFNNSFS
jgi:glycosyltransferase involved in cell wall biosynthesis